MNRVLYFYVIILLILGSCNTQRVVCPAYQSAFIFDKPTQKQKFSYYNESATSPKEIMALAGGKVITLPPRDSLWGKDQKYGTPNSSQYVMPGPALPQARRVKMDKYLLLPKKTYKKAMRALQTVEMKQVLPKKADSVDIEALLDSAARSITDTLTVDASKPKPKEEVDSVYTITKTKEKYNLDQDAYMWYFRDILVLPDVRAAMQENKTATDQRKPKDGARKEGFFKKLFGKKDKPKAAVADSLQVKDKNVVSDSTAVKKKKSLNPFKKKAPKVPEGEAKKKPDPAKKEDDGF